MPEIEDLAKLLDLEYILSCPPEEDFHFDVDFSTPVHYMVRKLSRSYEKDELIEKVDAWLFAHGNVCVQGHYGSADRERGFVIDYLKDVIAEEERYAD